MVGLHLLSKAAIAALFYGSAAAQNQSYVPVNSTDTFVHPPTNITTLDVYVEAPVSINGTNVTVEPEVQRVTFFEKDDMAIVYGDVIFSPVEDIRDAAVDNPNQKRSLSILRYSGLKWPGGVVTYRWEATPSAHVLNEWKQGMKLWTDRLPFLKFKEVATTAEMELGFLNLRVQSGGNACFSPIGMSPWAYTSVMVLDNCGVAVTAHEIGHTLGLYHEQQRPDRDEYLELKCENLAPDDWGVSSVCDEPCQGWGCNFRKLSSTEGDWSGTYDVDSIMHYGDSDFSIDWFNVPVLVGKKGVKLHRGISPKPTIWDAARVCNIYWEDCRGVCGDGILSPANGEECDDGNNIDGDGCSSSCKIESGGGGWCGDGIVQPGEDCDEGSYNGGPNSRCSLECRLPKTGFCGDGIVQNGEECDEGAANGGSKCTSSCKKPSGSTDTGTGGGDCAQCNPAPDKNLCHITTSCIPGSSGTHYCACAHGFRAADSYKAEDTSVQWRSNWPGQQGRVFVKPGISCNQLCDHWTLGRDGCSEVSLKDKC